MVDISDLNKASALLSEKLQIDQALHGLDEGGKIVSMTIGMPPAAGRPEGAGRTSHNARNK